MTRRGQGRRKESGKQEEVTRMRKTAAVLVPFIAGAVVAMQWKDISRYMKIELMSFGNGKPAIVPASGAQRYPDSPGKGVPDGTGAFDSASRGGPAAG